ncbi:MAG TPA: MucB/RseB C-terminal domain-containing protein [Thauera sp.]|jgi:sigma-E factor negative regulatory protein RseB|nr:MucB/RseB C-terminal domain-containing protein [Thauera sp.]HRA82234.1 MucB/RseB C-terminal domain-containing protein [Thauera sp.]
MRRFAAVVGLCAALLHLPAFAEAPDDPLSWLGRIASAGQRLNYVGTFMYQSAGHVETSRIAHKVDTGVEYERLEVLDGSPREVIRKGAEVRCVLPEQKTVIIDETAGRRAFPARLPVSPVGLAETYRIRKGEVVRVAGIEAQALVLEPRDDLRYGHTLWADIQSGLLLKARTVDAAGQVMEQFAFSDVRIGGELSDDLFTPRFQSVEGWRIVNARGHDLAKSDSGWIVADDVPGYVLTSVMRRPLGPDRGQAVHMVFSDGLASVSVFIEPVADGAALGLGPLASGAINIYKRSVDGHLITALGEVPERAVKRIGDAIRPAVP